MSSYRPSYGASSLYNYPPSPPSRDLPALRAGPPPGRLANGDSWRPNHLPQQEFTFRQSDSGPLYPPQRDPHQSYTDRQRRRNRKDDRCNLSAPRRGNNFRNQRGGPRITSDRPLLRQQHGNDEAKTEMLGVTEGTTKFLNLDEVDDSEEEEMDQSDSDREAGAGEKNGLGRADHDSVKEPPVKRRNLGVAGIENKWSNPDPYFVLPPIDETGGKRKDPIEIIRKHRKAEENKLADSNQVTANDDFISFTMDHGFSEISDESEDPGGQGVIGVPTGPRELRVPDGGIPNPGGPRAEDYSPPYPGHSFNLHELDAFPRPPLDGNYTRHEGKKDTFTGREPNVPAGSIKLDTQDEFNYPDSEYGMEVQGSSLGIGKRTRDDQFKGQAPRAAPQASAGLLPEWRSVQGINPIPWLEYPKYVTVNPGFRLHMEICDFFAFVKPRRFEETVREELLDRLQAFIRKTLPYCNVHCFGSFAAGLYLPNADMDVVVMSETYVEYGEGFVCQTKKKLWAFSDAVRKSGIAKPGSVNVIPSAKVPLVKFIDRLTNIRVDMSFENDSGVVAVETFHNWKRQFPAMPPLVTIIKQFLLMRGLNEVQHGGIGGFSVACLVTSLLQNMPRVQSGDLVPEEHMGETLIEFLDFYGRKFDISRTGIEMEPPRYFDKHAFNRPRFHNPGLKPSLPDRILIMDPNTRGHDISGGSRNVLFIFEQFARAHNEILSAMKSRNRRSLLDWMLGGDYSDILAQRNHLRTLYDRQRHRGPQPEGTALTDPKPGPPDVANNEATDAVLVGSPVLQKQIKRQVAAPDVAETSSLSPSSVPNPVLNISHTIARPEYGEVFHGLNDTPEMQRTRSASLKKEYPKKSSQLPDLLGRSAFMQHPEDLRLERQSEIRPQLAMTLKDQFPEATAEIPELIDQHNFIRLIKQFERERECKLDSLLPVSRNENVNDGLLPDDQISGHATNPTCQQDEDQGKILGALLHKVPDHPLPIFKETAHTILKPPDSSMEIRSGGKVESSSQVGVQESPSAAGQVALPASGALTDLPPDEVRGQKQRALTLRVRFPAADIPDLLDRSSFQRLSKKLSPKDPTPTSEITRARQLKARFPKAGIPTCLDRPTYRVLQKRLSRKAREPAQATKPKRGRRARQTRPSPDNGVTTRHDVNPGGCVPTDMSSRSKAYREAGSQGTVQPPQPTPAVDIRTV